MSSIQVWKYALIPPKEGNIIELEMPQGAHVLDAQIQRRDPVMWALVNPEAPKVMRKFYIAGTGHPIEENLRLQYIATFQIADAFRGSLVFHVFEVLP